MGVISRYFWYELNKTAVKEQALGPNLEPWLYERVNRLAGKGNHLFDCYSPPAITFERGEGAYLYTDEGERYLDFIAGIAVNALGHAPKDIGDAIKDQLDKVWHLSNLFRVPGQETLSQKYCDALPWAEKVFFQNSGTESLELAMKCARRYHYGEGNPDRYEIIAFKGAFHGRTFAAVNAAGNPKYLEGFGPALPGFTHLEFGDHDALKAAISDKTAAILVEPVQGEGGTLWPLPKVSAVDSRLARSSQQRTRPNIWCRERMARHMAVIPAHGDPRPENVGWSCG